MEELDEVSRRELLLKAQKVLEQDCARAEAEKRSLDAQIEARKRELRQISERVEAAKLQADEELKALDQASTAERNRLYANMEVVKSDMALLQSQKNKQESEYKLQTGVYEERLVAARSEWGAVSAALMEERSKLTECRELLANMREALSKV